MTKRTKVAMAVLRRDDGTARVVCVGCTMRLVELNMVAVFSAAPINKRQPEFVAAVYRVVPPHTIADCQIAVADRHIGPPPWGE